MNKITYKILGGILCITMIMLSVGCSSNYDSSEQYQDEESYTNQITNDTLYSTVLNKIYKIDVNTKEKEQIGKITEEEWRLLKQYRNLCEENKLTINILIQRLLAHEKGRE